MGMIKTIYDLTHIYLTHLTHTLPGNRSLETDFYLEVVLSLCQEWGDVTDTAANPTPPTRTVKLGRALCSASAGLSQHWTWVV